jgi:hypothetical protein
MFYCCLFRFVFFKIENHNILLFCKLEVLFENSTRVGTFVSNMVNTGLSFLGKLRSSPNIAQEQQANYKVLRKA